MAALVAPLALVEDRWRSAVSAVAAATVLAVAASDGDGTVLCPFRRATDGYCPLCGGTRAAASLVRADVGASWRLHPLVVLLGLQLPVLLWLRFTSKASDRQRRQWTGRLLMLNLALGLLVWGWRLAAGSIPPPTGLTSPLPGLF